jgi:hypothetical protein
MIYFHQQSFLDVRIRQYLKLKTLCQLTNGQDEEHRTAILRYRV